MKNENPRKKSLAFYGLLIIFMFSLFYCYDYLLQISISVFLPTIKSTFLLNDFQLGLIGSIFFITYVLLQVPGGYLIDHFGPWKVALWMSILCCIGALMMFFSIHSYALLLISRLFIGLGSSVSFLCAINVISIYSPLRFFSFFIGVLQALAGIGAVCGQAPIAYLNLYYPWNELALLFFILAFGFSVFFFLLMRKKINGDHSLINQAQKITPKAMYSILKNKYLLNISLLSFISWSPVASLAGFWMVQFLHDINHLSAIAAGSIITTFWLGMIIGSILIPIISEWNKRRKPILMFGFILQMVAIIIIITVPMNISLIAFSLFMLGFMCPIQGFCVVLLKDTNMQTGFGVGSGVINMFGTVSGGIMQFVIGFLLTYVFSGFGNPYAWSFGAYLLLSIVGLCICAVAYKESHPLRQAEVIQQTSQDDGV